MAGDCGRPQKDDPPSKGTSKGGKESPRRERQKESQETQEKESLK
jgi:hypothetical protein